MFKNALLQSNNIRILAVQLIQTAGNSIQPAELVQKSNENVTYFKWLSQPWKNKHVSTAFQSFE